MINTERRQIMSNRTFRLVLASAAAAMIGTSAPALAAQAGQVRHDRREIRQDRRELRRDIRHGERTREIRRDRRELRQDRRELRRDRRAANRYYYHRGQRIGRGYHAWTRYDRLPWSYRRYHHYNPRYRYIYRGNVVYVVDPRTQLVRDIVNLIAYSR